MELSVQGAPAVVPSDVATLTGAVVSVLAAVGAATKWVFTRIDARAAVEREWQAAERAKLEAVWASDLAAMRTLVETQATEISRMRNEIATYLRHVGVLEGILKARGIEFPAMPEGDS